MNERHDLQQAFFHGDFFELGTLFQWVLRHPAAVGVLQQHVHPARRIQGRNGGQQFPVIKVQIAGTRLPVFTDRAADTRTEEKTAKKGPDKMVFQHKAYN